MTWLKTLSLKFETKEKGYIISLYRSPSQTHDGFDDFWLTFEHALCDIIARNSLYTLVTGDFDAAAANWRRNVIATT